MLPRRGGSDIESLTQPLDIEGCQLRMLER
jgi:hypothetical protein